MSGNTPPHCLPHSRSAPATKRKANSKYCRANYPIKAKARRIPVTVLPGYFYTPFCAIISNICCHLRRESVTGRPNMGGVLHERTVNIATLYFNLLRIIVDFVFWKCTYKFSESECLVLYSSAHRGDVRKIITYHRFKWLYLCFSSSYNYQPLPL